MTRPITPLQSIHVDPFAQQEAEAQARAVWNTLQAIFSQLPAQILTALVNAILKAFGLSALDGDFDALIAAVNAAFQAIPGAVINGVTADWVGALALISAVTPVQFVSALLGLVAAAQRAVDGTMTVIGNGVANLVDNANGTWSFIVNQGETDIANLVQGADGAVYSVAHISQQASQGAYAAGVGVGQAISSGQQAIDHGIAAINGGAVQVGQEAHEYAAALTAAYTSLYNLWTSGSNATAAAADVAAAAAAAKAAADYQAQQTAGIYSQLPNFYGGSGTSGLKNPHVLFSGALPASFTSASSIATNGAIYNVATASTDQETVSAFWNTSLSSMDVEWRDAGSIGPHWARYLFLRSKSDLTTYLYVKYWFHSVVFGGGTGVNVQIGCVVGGMGTTLATDVFSSGPFYSAIANGPQAWSLEATGNAIQVTGPGGYSLSVTDGTPGGSPVVSQIGSLYRSAGIGSDEPNWLSNITDWNFYDSGPTAGPETDLVSTSESTTSTTFVNLATTTDQVTVNIGQSGLAIVFISCKTGNDGFYSDMSYELSGENTRAASSSPFARYQNPGSSVLSNTISLPWLETGLTPGATTFKAKYRANPGGGNTATFSDRNIVAIPL